MQRMNELCEDVRLAFVATYAANCKHRFIKASPYCRRCGVEKPGMITIVRGDKLSPPPKPGYVYVGTMLVGEANGVADCYMPGELFEELADADLLDKP